MVQVALEGAISRAAALTSLAQGNLPSGDLIPWTLGQQFQDPEFPRLSGARVVRIAVHPDLQRAGCAVNCTDAGVCTAQSFVECRPANVDPDGQMFHCQLSVDQRHGHDTCCIAIAAHDDGVVALVVSAAHTFPNRIAGILGRSLTTQRACRYGSRALELLRRYYEGDLADVVGNAADSDDDDDEDADDDAPGTSAAAPHANGTSNGGRGGAAQPKPLQEEVIAPRGGLPPLLVSRLPQDSVLLEHQTARLSQHHRHGCAIVCERVLSSASSALLTSCRAAAHNNTAHTMRKMVPYALLLAGGLILFISLHFIHTPAVPLPRR